MVSRKSRIGGRDTLEGPQDSENNVTFPHETGKPEILQFWLHKTWETRFTTIAVKPLKKSNSTRALCCHNKYSFMGVSKYEIPFNVAGL